MPHVNLNKPSIMYMNNFSLSRKISIIAFPNVLFFKLKINKLLVFDCFFGSYEKKMSPVLFKKSLKASLFLLLLKIYYIQPKKSKMDKLRTTLLTNTNFSKAN